MPFSIIEATKVSFKSKVGIARIEVPGFGIVDVEIFKPEGRPSFVAGKSVRSKFTGVFERTIAFDTDFAAELLEALDARLGADE